MKIKKFISFEGIDGAGKTTQINILKKKLEDNNKKVMVLREPGGTKITEMIRDIILNSTNNISKNSEMLLFLAARAELVNKVIKPALKDNYFVICDRYIDSTLAYQGYGRKINLKIINDLNNFVTSNILPACTFYLDIKPQIMNLRRLGNKNDRMEQSGTEFFEDVRNGYLILDKNEDRLIKIDANQDIDFISKIILDHLQLLFRGNL